MRHKSTHRRRVVVTGLGLVSPLGDGVATSWSRLMRGDSGVRVISDFETDDLACKIAAYVPASGEGAFDSLKYVTSKDLRKMDRFIVLGIAAAVQAVENAGLSNVSNDMAHRIGVSIGAGIGGLPNIHETAVTLHTRGSRRVSPFFVPSCLINLTAGHVSMRYGFLGPNHASVTACASGAHSIGVAMRMITHGDADVFIAGGSESTICRIGIAGFSALNALSTNFNHVPAEASRPWDRQRDGFVMGEGAGMLVLEELDHARRRGAQIYAELVGFGMSSDAYHITAPSPDGRGAYNAMKAALNDAGVHPHDIDYINAHGTSTPMGDEIELKAAHQLFEGHAHLSMSSTKSATGHLLGGAAGIESVFSVLSLKDQMVPPTLNLHDCDQDTFIDLVPHVAKEKKMNYALSNSFGFGGTNAALLFKKF